jgi:glycosyltransferase involved in cell wall biosynthesis
MRLGFFHKDAYPLHEGGSVQSWQIFSRLARSHSLVTPDDCPFPGAQRMYQNKFDSLKLMQALDAMFFIIDGCFHFPTEKFTALSLLKTKKAPVSWLINAPLDEERIFPGIPHHQHQKNVRYRKWLAKLVDIAFVVSEDVARYAHDELGIKQLKIIPNGSDTHHFHPDRQSVPSILSQFSTQFKVVWAGNGVYPWQGLDVVVEAARRCYAIDPSILFIVISDRTWKKLPPLPNLLLLPAVSYRFLPNLLAAADVCLAIYHPQFNQVFYNSPMKLFDYMAMGKPIIASGIGQIRSVIVEKKHGIFTTNSPDDLIKKIRYLQHNPVLAKKMANLARKSAEDYYNWDRVALEIDLGLRELIKK